MAPLPADETRTPDLAAGTARAPVEPIDPQITSIQPGGGVCMRLELAWGGVRRCWLRWFRRGYLKRMAETRQGDENVCPHEVLDPRDIKFFRNLGGYYWNCDDDPFTWRDRLPFARVGLAELMILAGSCFVLAAVAGVFYWPVAPIPAILGLFFVSFFRNPRRRIPTEAGLVVAPADGKVVLIEEVEHDEFVGGPAVLIGIFLSVFNVHINRSPVMARVVGLRYRRGKFLNAIRPESARENEQLGVDLEADEPPHRKMIVRQITGAIARRIVCYAAPGQTLQRGEQFGMIKLGSRTELVLPREAGLVIETQVGKKVKAGSSILARYDTDR